MPSSINIPFTRSRQHSNDHPSHSSSPSSKSQSSHHLHHNQAQQDRSSSPTITLPNKPQGPLRPEVTRPDPPHRHTTRSNPRASAKESLMSVLSSPSQTGEDRNGRILSSTYFDEEDEEDYASRQAAGQDAGVPDLIPHSHYKPGLTSNASFVTTSTASTKLLTPTTLSDEGGDGGSGALAYPYLASKGTVQGFSPPQYKYSLHGQTQQQILQEERQSTLLHSKFDGLGQPGVNGTISGTNTGHPHYTHHYNTPTQISSVIPDNLLPILEKPLMLGHGAKGGYGFPNTPVVGASGGKSGQKQQQFREPWAVGKSGNRHSEFGWDGNQNWRYTSQYDPNCKEPKEVEPTYFWLLTTYFSYLVLISLGHLRDFWGKRFNKKEFLHLMPQDGYAALMSDFDSFYTRRLKLRLDDCFSRPTSGVAGRTVTLLDRKSDDQHKSFQLTGTKTRALNISSYNYLGFAQATGGCADAVEAGIRKYGISAGGARLEAGTLDLHVQAEKLVSQFIGSEDAMIVSMGFATNSTTIPALVDRGCLVISDEFNHSSIRFGVRLSGAAVRTFKHNDMKALDTLLKESISQGQPRTHRPWKKILVIVEGLYSMEGSLLHLPELIVMKERYKFYLYVDEAHSIGALGPNGRGVCDYFGVDPRCVDILMGTFTKSFGASGGYIAGNKEVIDRIRIKSHSMAYAEAITPPVLTQIIASMASIMGVSPPLTAATSSPIHKPRLALHPSSSDTDLPALQMAHEPGPAVYGPALSSYLPPWLHLPPALLNGTEGRERLRRLAFNSRYLSSGLRKMGFIISGHRDSPIVPLFLFHPGKMPVFSRMMLERVGKDRTPVVVVVVAYPATPLISSRVRFCLSAAHTKHDIDLILRACDEIGDILDLKTGKNRWSSDEVIRRAEELVHEN